MTAWDTEDEYATAVPKSLPSPSNSSYSGRIKISQISNSSRPVSPPSLDHQELSAEDDMIENDSSSSFDPRRITPTLHANFVSEILSLRRSLEAKKKQIESLETTLYETRGEHEVFSAGLTSITKENHTLKRKLELVEAGTSTALSELSKDREKAREVASEARRRLEKAQKKIRSQDGEIDRIHALWARDKSSWEEEKRIIERRVHVAENRLKKVLEEVATYEINQNNQQRVESESENNDLEDNLIERHESDTESMRTRSFTNSVRFSMLSGLAGLVKHKPDGVSLADELNLDEQTELSDNVDCESVHSVNFSRHSQECRNDCLGLIDGTSILNNSSLHERNFIKRSEGEDVENDDKKEGNEEFLDADIKISQPSSANNDLHDIESVPREEVLISEGHEMKKRFTANHFLPDESDISQIKNKEHVVFDNSAHGCPVSPIIGSTKKSLDLSDRPILPCRNNSPLPVAAYEPTDMHSKSTQTDELLIRSFKSIPPLVVIPSIQLHPPLSTPASPNECFLPQYFKDKGCQVNISPNFNLKSTSMQTEEIRIDKRLNLLPLCFKPSAVSLNISPPKVDSPRIQMSTTRHSSSCSIKTVDEVDIDEKEDEDCKDRNKDTLIGDFIKNKDSPNSPTLDVDQIYTEKNSSDNELTDCEVSNVSGVSLSQSQPRQKHKSMDKSTRKKKALFYINEVEENLESTNSKSPIDIQSFDSIKAKIKQIENIIEVRHEQSRASILSMASNEPPFPIPARQSSRRPYLTLSLLNDTTNLPSLAQRRSFHRRSRSIHKVRSITAISGALNFNVGENLTQDISATPPLSPIPTVGHKNSSIHQLPDCDSIAPAQEKASTREGSHARNFSRNTFNSLENDSFSSDRATSVVSAIAHSMIGEWVYKYVRHRKPNSPSDSTGKLDNSKKVRHKRWIWLAPYDRAVMWSSKEPTSGTALLGKNGRRLIVQTVLDIKDENSAPKGVNLFHRSILILSPARALKFTATTMERHYTWLTALSFLAHSQKIPEPLSPMSDTLNYKSRSYSLLRKASIRDSIRVPKRQSNFTSKSGAVFNQSSQYASDIIPVVNSKTYCLMENPNFAADAPIVPRYTDRSISHTNNTITSNYFLPLYHRTRSNTSPRNIPPSSQKSGKQKLYSSKASASTTGISNIQCETNEINAFNSCRVPKLIMHTNHVYSDSNPHSNVNTCNYGGANDTYPEESLPINNNEFDSCGTVRMQAFISLRNSLAGLEFEGYKACPENFESEVSNDNSDNLEQRQDTNHQLMNDYVKSGAESSNYCAHEDFVMEKNQGRDHAHSHSDDIIPFPSL